MKIKRSIHAGWHFAPLFVLVAAAASAQDKPLAQLEPKESAKQLYTGISSVILPKDGIEINLINSLNSFWVALHEFDAQSAATRVADRKRYSRTDHTLRLAYGFASGNRWDLGASLHYTRVRLDESARSSPFRVFNDRNPADGTTYSGLSGLGLQIRAAPFAALPELTTLAGVVFPVAKSDELEAALNAQRAQLYLTGTFFQRLGPATIAFLQADWRMFLRNDANGRSLMAPSASGFLVFELPDSRWLVYPGLSYGITIQQLAKGSSYRQANQQLYGSLGILYRPGELFNVFLSGQIPFIFDSGSTQTIWVRESYTGLNLGFRVLL